MKKLVVYLCLLFLLSPFIVNAKTVNIYLFYGDGCSHCAALEEYLSKKENINLYKYETWFNKENETLLYEVSKITEVEPKGVPYYIIGSKTLQGYNDNEGWNNTVDTAIEKALTEDYEDKVGAFLGKVENVDIQEEKKEEVKDEEIVFNTSKKETDSSNKIIIAVIAIAIIDIVVTFIYLYKNHKKKL